MTNNVAAQLKRGISRQFSTGSLRRSLSKHITRQSSLLDTRRSNNFRFSFGRQSSLDPIRRSTAPVTDDELSVPENLDSTMQLLFMACRGDTKGVEDLLNEGIDVNSIDLDGRTALHIAACEGHVEVARFLLTRNANIDARDRWGSTAAADAKYYGHVEVYNILKARGAKVPKTSRRTPMAVANPREVPEYELNPLELQVRKADGITKGTYQLAKWNGTKVSVKILDKNSYLDPESINAFKHELTLLEKVRHPNVVQFVGAVTQNLPMMIVSEYHPKGDLGSYIQKKGRLSPSKALRFALDIARGMNYLHECKPDPIIHCDLKPKNILLDSGGQLKVAGFGMITLSKISPDKAKMTQPGALIDPSNFYVAPEVYNDQIFDRSVDAYSFGLILYEMIEGVQPFHPKPPEEAVKLMCLEGKRPPLKVKARSCPPELKELIEECWDAEAVVRPTFSEIIVRLDRIVANCSKQGWWKDTFKLPWK
ncbi:Pkinase_Tyr domain-containing protein/Ank_2 domain-containing protein [Cephalotus follicularis]|uniref:Pkinase_Tyr domain-containing protein/Ank_2 domain-containing protein n=1 Tax=Cephalotus follicularis TaxID=3775 RepID=A0A1Q3BGJ1_CEPFO|nr:Pkinase_Tyr domain-containing protein/Ank_2 domain-containing protein [Cephalotus follicularis]